MLATQGGRFGGWGFYLLKGKPVFVYDVLDLARPRVEASSALTPGPHKLVFKFKSDGVGLGKGGTGTITVDGIQAGSGTFPHTIPFALEAVKPSMLAPTREPASTIATTRRPLPSPAS